MSAHLKPVDVAAGRRSAGGRWVGGDDGVGSGAGISMVRWRRAVRTNFLIAQLVTTSI